VAVCPLFSYLPGIYQPYGQRAELNSALSGSSFLPVSMPDLMPEILSNDMVKSRGKKKRRAGKSAQTPLDTCVGYLGELEETRKAAKSAWPYQRRKRTAVQQPSGFATFEK
jgi:hypothetical protein